MNITILQGHFSPKEAEELITKMIDIKIKYHENKIGESEDHAEDIKMREKRIIQLQRDLYEVRRYIKQQSGKINLQAQINL